MVPVNMGMLTVWSLKEVDTEDINKMFPYNIFSFCQNIQSCSVMSNLSDYSLIKYFMVIFKH